MISRRNLGTVVLALAAATTFSDQSKAQQEFESSNLQPGIDRITAYFGTNRKWVGKPEYYSSDFLDDNDGISYESGHMDVVKTGNPPAWKYDINTLSPRKTPLMDALGEVEEFDENINSFLKATQENQARMGRSPANAGIVFIHGYAFSFLDMFGVVGQIAEGYNKPNILSFSWPSYGNHFKYLQDKSQAYASGNGVAAFIRYLIKQVDQIGGTPPLLNVVVHSMGHRVFSAAMQVLGEDLKKLAKRPNRIFNHAILMAADEDYRSLSQTNRLLPLLKLADNINIYVNSDDGALFAGQMANGGVGELGAYGPSNFPLAPNVIWIDVHDVALDNTPSFPPTLGHQYFRLSVPVMNDVRAVLAGTPASSIGNRFPDTTYKNVKFKIPKT